MNDLVLQNIVKANHIDDLADKISKFNKQFEMNNEEIKSYLCKINPQMNELLEEWKEERSSLKSMALTSVGYAIAILNYNVKTNESISFEGFI